MIEERLIKEGRLGPEGYEEETSLDIEDDHQEYLISKE